MMASQNGHVEVVDKLLQHGANVDLQEKVLLKLTFQLTSITLNSTCVLIYQSTVRYCNFQSSFRDRLAIALPQQRERETKHWGSLHAMSSMHAIT